MKKLKAKDSLTIVANSNDNSSAQDESNPQPLVQFHTRLCGNTESNEPARFIVQ